MTPSRRAESPASASPSRAPPQELLYAGACSVEETALSSALGTVVAHDSGTLKSRRLRYEACSPETLEQAYDRCGIVTEDYGRTFYMGARSLRAGGAAVQAALAARRRRKSTQRLFCLFCGRRLHAVPPLAQLTRRAPPPRSHAADDGAAAQGHLGHLRCVLRLLSQPPLRRA
jgi:hypothetical protein